MLRAPLLWQFQFPRLRTTKSRAAEGPIFRCTAKFCFHGIVFNVTNGLRNLLLIAHVMVPVVWLPEAPRPAEQFVRLHRHKGFPVLHNPRQWCRADLDERVDVVRHHHPGHQFKLPAMMETNRLFHQRRDAGITQKTFAEAAIQIILQFYPLFSRSNALRSGARSITPCVNGQQMFPFATPGGRHGIPKSKGDKLDQSRLVAVGQITAFVPAFEPACFDIVGQRLTPLLFGGDQPAQVSAFGLRRCFHRTAEHRSAWFEQIRKRLAEQCSALRRELRKKIGIAFPARNSKIR